MPKAGKSREAKTKGKNKKGQGGMRKSKPVVLKPEFIKDLQNVFAKHNWPGHPIGFVRNPATRALGFQPCDPGPVTCPDGSTPQTQWVHCPDGTSILRRFCP